MCYIKNNRFYAQTLRQHVSDWIKIGARQSVIDNIHEGVHIPFKSGNEDDIIFELPSRPIKK